MSDILRVLGLSIKRVITEQSSYIGSKDVNWDDVAAQVILHCDGKVEIMSAETFRMIADDAFIDLDDSSEPIPFELTEKGKLMGREPKIPLETVNWVYRTAMAKLVALAAEKDETCSKP